MNLRKTIRMIFYGSLDVTIDCVREEDWANNWKQYYKPFTVGEKADSKAKLGRSREYRRQKDT